METTVAAQFKELGLAGVLAFAAMGSAWGAGAAGMAAIGAWKKALMQNKAAPLILVAFVGAPLTQTVYGFILVQNLAPLVEKGLFGWSVGILCGIAMGLSALFQGKAGAVAADAMGETGKGFGNYIMVLGIIETVALFVMVFSMAFLGKLSAG